MQIFDAFYLNELSSHAKINKRFRQHRNIHKSYKEICQRFFNAIELESYIRPHRHCANSEYELLVAVRGCLALFTFDDYGKVTGVFRFGTENHGDQIAVGVEVPPNIWHTVIALKAGCVLLEVKQGPFDPKISKDYAPWAPPEEDSSMAKKYLKWLKEMAF